MPAWPSFGVRLDGSLSARACIDMTQAAEASGYDSVWMTENLFKRGMLPAAAAAIAATHRIRVGLGVINPYTRHPVQIAMDVGALDELSPGRVALGVGSGNGERLRRIGARVERPVAAVHDAIAMIRALLAGERVESHGPVFSAAGVKLDYAAATPQLPIYAAAMGDQAVRGCGAVADGLIVSNMCAPGFATWALEVLDQGARRAGRPVPRHVIHHVFCVTDRDGATARRRARHAIAARLAAYWSLGAQVPVVREAVLRASGIDPVEYPIALGRLAAGENTLAVLDDRYLDAYALAGTPEQCAESALRFAAAGATEVVLGFCDGDVPSQLRALGGVFGSRR